MELSLITAVAKSAQMGLRIPRIGGHQPYRCFGMGPDQISFIGPEAVQQFEECSHKLWAHDRDILQTVSLASVESAIVALIRDSHAAQRDIVPGDINTLLSKLKEKERETWTILRKVHGAKLSADTPLELGPYKIFGLAKHRGAIETIIGADNLLMWQPEDSSVIISVDVIARDEKRAKQLADALFRRFENILGFIISDPDGHNDVGVLTHRWPQHFEVAIKCKDWRSIGGHREGVLELFPLDHPSITTSEGNKWIWKQLSNPHPSVFSRRILRAIDWFGRAIRDSDVEDSFVQFFFGIEALLKIDGDGPISPSVTSQVCEYAAFILANDLQRRMKIDSKMRRLYGKRSALAHGGSGDIVTTPDRLDAAAILRSLIGVFLHHPELSNMRTAEDVREWVRTKRFS